MCNNMRRLASGICLKHSSTGTVCACPGARHGTGDGQGGTLFAVGSSLEEHYRQQSFA